MTVAASAIGLFALGTTGDARAQETCSPTPSCITGDPGSDFALLQVSAKTNGTGNGLNVVAANPDGNTGGSHSAIVGVSNGTSTTSNGVAGATFGTQPAAGVFGQGGSSAYGVSGTSQNAAGLNGNSTTANGVQGFTTGFASGVYGQANPSNGTCKPFCFPATFGVAGRIQPAGVGTAVLGDNLTSTGWAGFFNGQVYVATNMTVAGFLSANGSCLAGTCSSDIRLKKNVQALPPSQALERVTGLRPVTYEWIDPEAHFGAKGTQKGFIAQDVEKVLPEWVGVDDKGYKTLDTHGIEATALLVASIKALKDDNDELRHRVQSLESARHPMLGSLGGGALGILGVMGMTLVLGARRKRDEHPQNH